MWAPHATIVRNVWGGMKKERRQCRLAFAMMGCLMGATHCARRPPVETRPEGAATLSNERVSGAENLTTSYQDSAEIEWAIEPAEDGTLRVLHQGKQILAMHYLFWGEKWSWADSV